MPSRGLRYTKDIAKLRAQGRSDAEIAEQIGIAKSIVHRNLHRTRTQQRLARILADTGLYALKQVLASTEVVYRWTEQERLKLLEGQSQLTAENVGTLVRMQDKNLLLAKALLGKSFRPGELANQSTKALTAPSEDLKAILRDIESEGNTVEEDDDAGHA